MRAELTSLLKDYDKTAVEIFITYCENLKTEKKNGQIKNVWMGYKKPKELADFFIAVEKDGLHLDGDHITIISTGVSYDHVAYKNKMLLSYPESLIDVSLVFQGDAFSFKKESGKALYTHEIKSPFGQTEANVEGGYCVIKNKRGEFITLLSKADIDKHRKVAKGDFIWAKWYKEMAQKTVVKKACKQHFSDIYMNIETLDNENYDLENPLNIEIEDKQKIESINTLDELKEYYLANKGKGKDFDIMVTKRKQQLTPPNNDSA